MQRRKLPHKRPELRLSLQIDSRRRTTHKAETGVDRRSDNRTTTQEEDTYEMQTAPKRRWTTTRRLLLPVTIRGVGAVDDADMAADIAAGDGHRGRGRACFLQILRDLEITQKGKRTRCKISPDQQQYWITYWPSLSLSS